MNRQELNWLLQMIEDAETAERLVLAQYERGRISFQTIADVSERRTRRRSSYGQFGGVTRTVLREAGLPVLMSR